LTSPSSIRIGNPEYARRNRTYGLTTLRVRHVDLTATKLHFEFVGKSGKEQA
jgi:DNA topoisomerase-1